MFGAAAREDPMAGKGKKSEQRKKLVKKLAKKVIKKVKKEEKKSNDEVDRSDVKPPSPFSS
jgi:transcriptional regulator of met regulon